MNAAPATPSLSLEDLDSLQVDSYVLFLNQDERPPQGLAGLVDWRLAGALSRQLKGDFFDASKGDSLLLSTSELSKSHQLPGSRLFVFGLGPAKDLRANPETFVQVAKNAAAKVERAGGSKLLIALPALLESGKSAPILKASFEAAQFDELTLAGALPRKARLPRSTPSQVSQPPPVRSFAANSGSDESESFQGSKKSAAASKQTTAKS